MSKELRIMILKNRITLMMGCGNRDNSNIIRKCERKLRQLQNQG